MPRRRQATEIRPEDFHPWMLGKNLATVMFVVEAERYLADAERRLGKTVRGRADNILLEEKVERLKYGQDSLNNPLTVGDYLASAMRGEDEI